MPQRGHKAGPGAAAGVGETAGGASAACTATGAGVTRSTATELGSPAGLAGYCAAATEARDAALGAEAGWLGPAAAMPPGCHAVGAEASLDAAAASCGEVAIRGRGPSCAAADAGATAAGVWATEAPAPVTTGFGEAGATRWAPRAALGRTRWGAEPGAAMGRATGAPAGLDARGRAT